MVPADAAVPPRQVPAGASGQASPTARFSSVLRLGSIGSTNELAMNAARAGTAEGLVVVADEQFAGRGRRSRRWLGAPGGSLLCSVLLRPPLDRAALFFATSAVALAALDACGELAPSRLSIKWPNDLVAPAGKVAGVLAELADGAPPAVVVGIGLNLFWPTGWKEQLAQAGSEQLLAGAASLEEAAGVKVGRDAFLDVFLFHLERRYAVLLGGGGVEATAAQYRAACSTIGAAVLVEMATERVRGVAVGVEDSGALLVEVDGVLRRVEVADVVHLRPAPGIDRRHG